MNPKRYEVTMIGKSPLLMHSDNLEFDEPIKKWQKDPKNKDFSVAGDDRSPAWTWLRYCYNDGKVFTMDVDCIMACLRVGGSKVKHPNGKGTLKVNTQSGIIAEGLAWPLLLDGKTIPWEPFKKLMDDEEKDFSKYLVMAQKYGFTLNIKRALIASGFGKGAKHVRVRPMFSDWTLSGTILVMDDILTKNILETVFYQSGYYAGLGDWRPGSKTPGQFGTFKTELKEVAI